jgi:hypothetical protein
MRKNIKHGLSFHPLYVVWSNIKARCYYKKAKSYSDYGQKGVTMCSEWKNNFKSFYDWCIENGWSKGLEIDKDIKGTGLLYSPEMCLIVTRKENVNNKSNKLQIEFNGETKNLSEWQDRTGIEQGILWDRIFRYKWSAEKALTEPIIDKRKSIICVETGEVFKSISQAAIEKNANRTNIFKVLSGERHTTGGFSFKYLN